MTEGKIFNRMIIHIFDLVGTFAFAVSGAFRAIKYELDLLGLTSLAVVSGIGGGIPGIFF